MRKVFILALIALLSIGTVALAEPADLSPPLDSGAIVFSDAAQLTPSAVLTPHSRHVSLAADQADMNLDSSSERIDYLNMTGKRVNAQWRSRMRPSIVSLE